MSHWKRALCLVLCLCVCCCAGSCVYAADQADISTFIDRYSDLFDGVLDSVGDFSDFQLTRMDDQLLLKLQDLNLDSLGEDLKAFLKTSAELSDEELMQAISDMAGDRGIPLTDSQLQQLCNLSRKLEKVSSSELDEKLEKLKETVDQADQDRQKVTGFFQKLREAATKVISVVRKFLDRIQKKSA